MDFTTDFYNVSLFLLYDDPKVYQKVGWGNINGATEAILQFQFHSRVIRNKVPKIGAFLNPQKRSFLATFS